MKWLINCDTVYVDVHQFFVEPPAGSCPGTDYDLIKSISSRNQREASAILQGQGMWRPSSPLSVERIQCYNEPIRQERRSLTQKIRRTGCFECKHFYITWDKHYPRGCKAMGFKSMELPWRVVLNASGRACLKFAHKNRNRET